jgi:hypothetical protein
VNVHFNKIAMITAPSASPDEYARFVHAESIKWAKVVNDAHITAQ